MTPMSAKPYRVVVADRVGPIVDESFATFADALACASDNACARVVCRITNSDACDYDHDGLTPDERDQLDDACW